MGTSITEKELIILKQTMLDSKTKNPIEIFENNNNVIGGGLLHQRVANYIIGLLMLYKYKCQTEVGVYLKGINKAYRLDVLATKGNKRIAIECGNTQKAKLVNLNKHFDIIHLSYSNFKILMNAERIKQSIIGVIK